MLRKRMRNHGQLPPAQGGQHQAPLRKVPVFDGAGHQGAAVFHGANGDLE